MRGRRAIGQAGTIQKMSDEGRTRRDGSHAILAASCHYFTILVQGQRLSLQSTRASQPHYGEQGELCVTASARCDFLNSRRPL
jgi:hypothetical protein